MKWKRIAEKNERNSREINDKFLKNKKKMELGQGIWIVTFGKKEVREGRGCRDKGGAVKKQ